MIVSNITVGETSFDIERCFLSIFAFAIESCSRRALQGCGILARQSWCWVGEIIITVV